MWPGGSLKLVEDAPLKEVSALVDGLGVEYRSVERDGERVVVVVERHWAHNQLIEQAIRDAGYEYERRAAGGMSRHVVAAPLPEGAVVEARRRFTVVVEPHPILDGYFNLSIPGIPRAIWGDREPEGRVSVDMATALINSWHGLMPDQVELVFEYR